MRYTAKVIDQIKNRPGSWNSLRVGVFENDVQIGEYVRNYSNLINTFYPFKFKDRWFALYSPNYDSSAIMSLWDCKHWCNIKDSRGFCPTSFYVPELCVVRANPPNDPEPKFDHEKYTYQEKINGLMYCFRPGEKGYKGPYLKEEYESIRSKWLKDSEQWVSRNMYETYADYGFVGGCIWGDDSTDKVRFIDLKDLDNKNAIMDERFGYIEIGMNANLKDSIYVDAENDDSSTHRFFISEPQIYEFNGTKRIS